MNSRKKKTIQTFTTFGPIYLVLALTVFREQPILQYIFLALAIIFPLTAFLLNRKKENTERNE